jgi:serine protease Do
MDDSSKPTLDLNEIDRIQREIEQKLYGKPAVSTPVAEEFAEEPNTEPEPLQSVFYHETIKNETLKYKKKKRFRRRVALALIICSFGTGALGLGAGICITLIQSSMKPGIGFGIAGNDNSDLEDDPFFQEAFEPAQSVVLTTLADVVKMVAPAVVSINTVIEGTSDYFSLPYDQSGDGSGIMFYQNSTTIYIATNYHVISGASSVTINIEDSEPIVATFVGSEPNSDLAVISVKKTDVKKAGVTKVTIAAFGDSDSMMVGETVIAIGNAMGEGNTATSGIISATNKQILVEQRNLTVIQTDAAINPGNSGGPLVNTLGQVIGINTAKFSQQNAEGMGYSITSNIAKPIVEEIMKQNPKPFLGIKGNDVTEQIAQLYSIPQLGVFVVEVVSGSSAEKAGIMRNDIITSFNDISIFSMEQLQEEIQHCKVGDEVQVKVYREGKNPITFKLKLAEYKSDNF